MTSVPHRRYNPLEDHWIIVSPHRISRPWNGQVEPKPKKAQADDQNPLLPGATRPGGVKNPLYQSTFVFTNDFSALLPDADYQPPAGGNSPLFRSESAKGTCRVMCFHPKTELQLATMNLAEIVAVVNEWIRQLQELGNDHTWVQIFENKGEMMGCSNGHPHCQIWASKFLPSQPTLKDRTQRQYHLQYGKPMLVDYLREELIRRERLVVENDHWAIVVPYWACWPFETMMLPKRHILRLTDLTPDEVESAAAVIKSLLIRYDNLFNCSFPYSMGWHGAPTGHLLQEDCQHWQLQAVWLPPLLRSADVRKFMAGYELVCEPQRDLTPEKAAEMLRSQADIHYTQQETSGGH